MSKAVLYSNLPQSELVGVAANREDMTRVLEVVTQGGLHFSYFDRALGGPRSCRLLFQEHVDGLTTTPPFCRPFSPKETADEFFNEKFMEEVRCDPFDAPSQRESKGWEIRVAQVSGKTVVIVLAVWVRLSLAV